MEIMREEQKMAANEYRISFWDDENVLKSDYGNDCTML